ncbi:MAG: ATPase [Candidatus Raymondbacteria bacterium RifOxyA12_full_50_37]|uniref:ATPase n=1 Tax=Candidatus Raymondbacteria bacterium RIFOXYD12_FULL_49_13 TaxID=1817890 RepID=A0A1F7F8U5_UNCRA|nr:MAG: ATPase [Candidatus Raymondbacteria bacterium RifOxyA12_full_50_37]OGJ85418.1 MAG: ATPase [Candidatus Raymondbacteria bacterium RIFOXYA2_FULL_49_16]OGJ86142.1 MAG: ATPase [Candidatus Raymondbacteria bacterium RifOxyB12_full_50_8]OGJ94926.1 MAG: ATPase [Candidatus Raymondbacteria bacterium RIFOXYC2_FULL_50_21]OGJ98684.1 MAG: ATPase [Candidatus Raymondbacteria bacterium RifOxyC12_full_50_8]OGK03043.1 MAG: ATPase [Candidatus Raymondbacteria bacterium RIFOXYD12_FULL_49_13]OGP45558.1 MAG: A
MEKNIMEINEKIKEASAFVDLIYAEMGKVIVGQRYMVERLLIGLLTRGHVLLEGVPGLAKTMTVNTLAKVLDTGFKRIQFTPDLLPADLIGTMIYNQKQGDFVPRKGPIFSNIILADEINRAPSKVQSALLEVMQEHQVTIGDATYRLDEPFLVLATQNPIEQEGTYPLPEAQIDRFMLKLFVDYPSREEELQIINRMAVETNFNVGKIIGPKEILEARKLVETVYIDEKIKQYIVSLVFATRDPAGAGVKEVKGLIEYGASPRASIYLTMAAKAHAFVKRRGFVTPEDVKSVGFDILRHRIILTYEAEAEEMSADEIIKRVFDAVEVP